MRKLSTPSSKTPPSIIPLNYNYQTMSPSSSVNNRNNVIDYHQKHHHHHSQNYECQQNNEDDNQYTSLFGDPVPPPPFDDFLGEHFGSSHLYGKSTNICDDIFSHRNSFDDDTRTMRLFPQTPYISVSQRIDARNNERLKMSSDVEPPDIQILPNSSESSSDNRNSSIYLQNRNCENSQFELNSIAASTHSITVKPEVTRRVSDISEDFKSNVGSLSQPPPDIPEPPAKYFRQTSNESCSSSEWFKPLAHDFSEFTKIPKMRPSSKKVLSIKRDEMPMEQSPIVSMINDSNGSSSGDDHRLMADASISNLAPIRPPEPLHSRLTGTEQSSYHEKSKKYSTDSLMSNFLTPPTPPLPPPPVPPAPTSNHSSPSKRREMSPVIFKDSVTTGADFRVDQTRSHKKTSFTIINDKSPQSSRPQSPTAGRTQFPGHGLNSVSLFPTAKPIAKPRHHLQKKSMTSINLKLPTIDGSISEDSPRTSVQFNMTGHRNADRMLPSKGILQYSSSRKTSQNILPPLLPLEYGNKVKSCETLPLITDPYRTAIPRLHRSQQDLQKETNVTRQKSKPNPNPTRKQRGLLRVICSAESGSRIPVRSNWSSADDLPSMTARRRSSLSPLRPKSRRSSSTSPERRSSTQTELQSSLASDRRSSNLSSVTTSDFSYRKNSFSSLAPPTASRRKSIFQPTDTRSNILRSSRTPRKVAKPTTLSPIIGTPNKDSGGSPRSPVHRGSNARLSSRKSEIYRRDSMSKIPVRNSFHDLNVKTRSLGNSCANSRSNSPSKDFGLQLDFSGLHSRSNSRSPSRTTRRSDSRSTSRAADSRGPSRSTSRASTRQISRGPSRSNSRGGNSRPNSRMEQAKDLANSRSNSRLSQKRGGSLTNISPSPRNSPPRKNLASHSSNQRNVIARRKSLSPGKNDRNQTLYKNRKSPEMPHRSSRSRIPARVPMKISSKSNSKSRSPPKTVAQKRTIAPTTAAGLRKGLSMRGSQKQKDNSSAKKIPGSVRKPESSVRRTPSSVRKVTAATKKQSNVTQKTGLDVKTGSGRRKAAVSSKGQKERSSHEVASTETKRQEIQSTQQAIPADGAKNIEKIDETSSGGQEKARGRLERQSSSLSLIRIGSRLNLLSKKASQVEKISSGDGANNNSASDSNGKLLPLTKANVISMTTAAITAQPVQITTALTNQLPKMTDDMTTLPAAIIEKSQKTLENIQKTVTEATDEIHKTINENLTDLKTFENDMGKMSGDGRTASPTASNKTVKDRQSLKTTSDHQKTRSVDPSIQSTQQPIEASVSVINGNHGSSDNEFVNQTTDGLGERVSERAISVLPDVVCESANFQNSDLAKIDENPEGGVTNDAIITAVTGDGAGVGSSSNSTNHKISFTADDSSPVDRIVKYGDGERTGSQELLKADGDDEDTPRGWRKCCSKLCMPCRRSQCCKCCQRSDEIAATDESERPVLSATSSTTTTNLDVVDEAPEKSSCWKKIICCKRKEDNSSVMSSQLTQHKMGTIQEEQSSLGTAGSQGKQGKCGACVRKIFCCRSTNKIEAAIAHDEGEESEVRKCCFCIPCKKKAEAGSVAPSAWEDPERAVGVDFADQAQEGKCARFCKKLLCCKKKSPPVASDSRRASMKTTMPPPEDTRRKLHVDLVEYNSKMKGAIPVMPLYLAWFCAICNTLFPGLGTLLSGFFCLCVGIPRFSSYDSAKARIGSLVINCIVAVSQLFCVLFCFVGWGWSIWWGTIMLKTAKKLAKIRKVEKLEMEEEQRQAEAAARAAATASAQPTNLETAAESDTETKNP